MNDLNTGFLFFIVSRQLLHLCLVLTGAFLTTIMYNNKRCACNTHAHTHTHTHARTHARTHTACRVRTRIHSRNLHTKSHTHTLIDAHTFKHTHTQKLRATIAVIVRLSMNTRLNNLCSVNTNSTFVYETFYIHFNTFYKA